jgi:acyl carrier protein/NADP-dependent 3-hydroxy acid dehydrogenase YdfG
MGRKKDIGDWFYIPQWTRSPLIPGSKKTPAPSPWLIFMDDRGLGEQLMKALEKQGLELIMVRKAKAFAGLNDKEYTLAPGEKEHYEALFQELQAGGRIPGKIIHLWNVTGDPGKPLTKESLEEAEETGFYSLLRLAQSIGRLNAPHTGFQIEVISDNMQEVIAGEGRCPQKSLLLGPVTVIPKEYPNIRCRSIDIQFPFPAYGFADANAGGEGSAGEFPVEQLVREISAEQVSSEPAAALRGNYRWVPAFKPARLEKSQEHPLPPCLKQNGVYLVTGGLGGIGLVLAEHLVKSVQARVVLTGRSAFPPEEEWDRWLGSHDKEDRTGVKIRKVRELEAQGGEVLVFSADAADEAQMQTVKEQTLERFGRIDGVIHAAGVPEGGMIQQRGRGSFEPVLAPKVKGTLVLETLLNDQKPDFFILCSSLSSFLSPFGQVGYCSANAFLDAFALYRNDNIISINWDSWKEVGMAVEAAKQLELDAGAAFKDSLSPAEGVDVFNRILEVPLPFPRVAVSTRDLQTMTEMQDTAHLQVSGFMDASKQRKKHADEPLHQRPDLSTAYVEPEDELEQTIAVILQDFLGIEKVGIDDNFFDLGISSLDLVQISGLLKEKLGKEVPVVTLFTYATVRTLARYLQQENKEGDETGEAVVQDEPEGLLESTIDLLNE